MVDWDGLVPIGTLNGENSIGYTLSAGTLPLHSLKGISRAPQRPHAKHLFFNIFLRVDRYPYILVILNPFFLLCTVRSVPSQRDKTAEALIYMICLMAVVAFPKAIPVKWYKSTFCSYSKGKCYPLLRPEKVSPVRCFYL